MLTILETCGIVAAGILLLRFSGRKSVSQMTIGTTVVLLMLGTLLANPIASRGFLTTVLVVAISIGFLVILEYLELKFRPLSKLISGGPIIVIDDGQVCTDALRKTRIPLHKLEMRLRVAGINRISDVKKATIEINGELGYELIPNAKPITVGDFETRMDAYVSKLEEIVGSARLAPSASHAVHLLDKEDLMVQSDEHPLQ